MVNYDSVGRSLQLVGARSFKFLRSKLLPNGHISVLLEARVS